MTDIEMLSLPEGEAIGWAQAWGHDQMRAYARAVAEHNVKARDAEIEALRALLLEACDDGDEADADLLATLERARAAEARAERLAEALRDIESRPWNGVRPIQIAARAALRGHDQEGKDG